MADRKQGTSDGVPSLSSRRPLREIIDLNLDDPEFTCVGFAATTGQQCQIPIRSAIDEANWILVEAEDAFEAGRAVESHLEDLATLVLCNRFHSSQHQSIVERWSGDIRSHTQAMILARPKIAAHGQRARSTAVSAWDLGVESVHFHSFVPANGEAQQNTHTLKKNHRNSHLSLSLLLPSSTKNPPGLPLPPSTQRFRGGFSLQLPSINKNPPGLPLPPSTQRCRGGFSLQLPSSNRSPPGLPLPLSTQRVTRGFSLRLPSSNKNPPGLPIPSSTQPFRGVPFSDNQTRTEELVRRPAASDNLGSPAQSIVEVAPSTLSLVSFDEGAGLQESGSIRTPGSRPISPPIRQSTNWANTRNSLAATIAALEDQLRVRENLPFAFASLQIAPFMDYGGRQYAREGTEDFARREAETILTTSVPLPDGSSQSTLESWERYMIAAQAGVRRLRVEDEVECAICFELLVSANARNQGEVVWCRAQCGHNLHRRCMQVWAAMRRRSSDAPNCPHW